MSGNRRKPLRPSRWRTYIRAWRDHRHLTQERLAERVGVSTATISRVERGEQAYTQGLVEALAEALQCSPADLLGRPPESAGFELYTVIEALRDDQKKQALRVLKALVEAAA